MLLPLQHDDDDDDDDDDEDDDDDDGYIISTCHGARCNILPKTMCALPLLQM